MFPIDKYFSNQSKSVMGLCAILFVLMFFALFMSEMQATDARTEIRHTASSTQSLTAFCARYHDHLVSTRGFTDRTSAGAQQAEARFMMHCAQTFAPIFTKQAGN